MSNFLKLMSLRFLSFLDNVGSMDVWMNGLQPHGFLVLRLHSKDLCQAMGFLPQLLHYKPLLQQQGYDSSSKDLLAIRTDRSSVCCFLISCTRFRSDEEGSEGLSVWDSNAESVRRNRVRLKSGILYPPDPAQRQRRDRGRFQDREQQVRREADSDKWQRRRFEEDYDDAYEYEDEDDDEGFDLRTVLVFLGIGLPVAFTAVPWLVGHPMALPMVLALAPVVQRVSGFFISVYETISKGFGTSSRQRVNSSYRRSSSYRKRSRFYRDDIRRGYSSDEASSDEETDNLAVDSWGSNPVQENTQKEQGRSVEPSLGGWDELEQDRKLMIQRGRNRPPRMSRLYRKEMPLFWRVVLAFFPFLRSWGGFL